MLNNTAQHPSLPQMSFIGDFGAYFHGEQLCLCIGRVTINVHWVITFCIHIVHSTYLFFLSPIIIVHICIDIVRFQQMFKILTKPHTGDVHNSIVSLNINARKDMRVGACARALHAA